MLSDRLKRALHERAAVMITDALASSEGGPFAFAVTSSLADLPSRFFPAAATRVLTADGTEVVPGSGQVGTLAFGGPIPEGYYKDRRRPRRRSAPSAGSATRCRATWPRSTPTAPSGSSAGASA